MFPKASMLFIHCGYSNTASLIHSALSFTHFSLFHFPSLFQILTFTVTQATCEKNCVCKHVCTNILYVNTYPATHKVRSVLYISPSTAFKESHLSRTKSVMFGFKTIGSSEITLWNNPGTWSGWGDVSKFTLASETLNEVLTLS